MQILLARLRTTGPGLFALLAGLVLSACSSVQKSPGEPLPDLAAYGTFAGTSGFQGGALEEAGEGESGSDVRATRLDPELEQRFDAAIAARLIELGLEPADRVEAKLLVAKEFELSERTVFLDPWMAIFHTGERYEDGILRLTLLDAETLETLWQGEARQPLRLVARGHGALNTKWTPTQAAPSWRVKALVSRLLE